MCAACGRIHTKPKVTRNHRVFTLAEAEAATEAAKQVSLEAEGSARFEEEQQQTRREEKADVEAKVSAKSQLAWSRDKVTL